MTLNSQTSSKTSLIQIRATADVCWHMDVNLLPMCGLKKPGRTIKQFTFSYCTVSSPF